MRFYELKKYILDKLISLDETEIKIECGYRSLNSYKFKVLESKDERLGPVIRKNIDGKILNEIRERWEGEHPEFSDCNPMIRCILCHIKYKKGGACWKNVPCNKGVILDEV